MPHYNRSGASQHLRRDIVQDSFFRKQLAAYIYLYWQQKATGLSHSSHLPLGLSFIEPAKERIKKGDAAAASAREGERGRGEKERARVRLAWPVGRCNDSRVRRRRLILVPGAE